VALKAFLPRLVWSFALLPPALNFPFARHTNIHPTEGRPGQYDDDQTARQPERQTAISVWVREGGREEGMTSHGMAWLGGGGTGVARVVEWGTINGCVDACHV